MATPPQMMQQPGPSPMGGPSPTAQPTPAVVQIVANISQLAQMLSQVFPPAAPMAQEIQSQVNQVQAQMASTTNPAQTQAPPI